MQKPYVGGCLSQSCGLDNHNGPPDLGFHLAVYPCYQAACSLPVTSALVSETYPSPWLAAGRIAGLSLDDEIQEAVDLQDGSGPCSTWAAFPMSTKS